MQFLLLVSTTNTILAYSIKTRHIIVIIVVFDLLFPWWLTLPIAHRSVTFMWNRCKIFALKHDLLFIKIYCNRRNKCLNRFSYIFTFFILSHKFLTKISFMLSKSINIFNVSFNRWIACLQILIVFIDKIINWLYSLHNLRFVYLQRLPFWLLIIIY